MRLNLINRTVIAAGALKKHESITLSARFGKAHRLDDKSFKFADPLIHERNVLIERVDLGELFKGVIIDISKLEFNDPPSPDVDSKWHEPECDLLMAEPMMIDGLPDTTSPADPLGKFFSQWKRLIGLGGLTRVEVELSTLDDFLTIDARNATVYCGSVRIKYK